MLLVIAVGGEMDAALGGLLGAGASIGRPGLWERREAGRCVDVVLCGVGKANAAAATARAIDPVRHGVVLSAGVCGALPGSGLVTGDAVAATRSVNADEGIALPGGGFESCTEMGFPTTFARDAVPADPAVVDELARVCDAQGPIATVSACSGTDALALGVASRTGALVEAMEGAAAGRVAEVMGVAFGELRVVSNQTGDRDKQVWDLPRAFARLGEVLGRLASG
ncbi:MAG: futalosine hydrolase [Planctomycetota bacterium]